MIELKTIYLKLYNMKKILTFLILCFISILILNFSSFASTSENYKNIVQVRWCKYPIGDISSYVRYPDLFKANPYNALRRDNCQTVYDKNTATKIQKQYSLKEVLNLPYMKKQLIFHQDEKWLIKNYWPLCYNISSQSVYSIYFILSNNLDPKKVRYKKRNCETGGGFMLDFDGKNYYYLGKKERDVARAIDYLLDQKSLDKLLKAANDFKEKKITELQFEQIKDELLKEL